MRILYLVHQYAPESVGGTEVYLRSLAARIAAAGHQVEILAHREWVPGTGHPLGPDPCPVEVDGIRVHGLRFALGAASHPAAAESANPSIGAWVRDKLRELRPDLVHVLHPMKLSASALAACRVERMPYLVTLTDFWAICLRHTLLRPDGAICEGPSRLVDCLRCARATHGFCAGDAAPLAWPRPFDELATRLGAALAPGPGPGFWSDASALARRGRFIRRQVLAARRIFVLSEFQRRLLVRNGYPPRRLELEPHGLELRDLDGFAWRPGPVPRVAFIGSLVPHKGLHLLIEALSRRPGLPLSLRVHGRGVPGDAYGEEVLAAARRDPRIVLAGTFPPDECGRVLSEADAVAIPALWYENEPLVAKAALALGLPLLASRIGSLAGMVSASEGELVEPGSVEGWIQALERVATLRGPPAPRPGRIATMETHAARMAAVYAAERGASS